MLGKPGLELLIVFVAAVLVSVAQGGGYPTRVLNLERAFPVNQKVEVEVLRAIDKARHPRFLQSVVGGVVDFPVVGTYNPYKSGLYLTKVKLGSPPREFTVQIDTGSDILWVTCNPCEDCPQSSEIGVQLSSFDATSSSTSSLLSCSDSVCASIVQTAAAQCSSQDNQCSYTFQYGDGSGTSGHYVTDLLYFDAILGPSVVANSSASIVFGCSTYQSGDLAKPTKAVDGIFGFGQQETSVISQLSSRGITPRVFSHCLRGDDSGGGILVLGEILAPSIVYSPLVPSHSKAAYISPRYPTVGGSLCGNGSIAVNGQVLPIDAAIFATSSNQGTIVDSGTTLSYLVEGAFDPFVSAITATVAQMTTSVVIKGFQCFVLTSSLNDVFPTISFNFAGGASMILRPVDYLITGSSVDGDNTWCIGFQRVPNPGVTILGDLTLKDKVFVYDLARQRIGWADYDCSTTVNVSMTSGKNEYVSAGQLSASSSSINMQATPVCTSISALFIHILLYIGLLFL